MTRNELKDIIKECILEVMLDGIRNDAPASLKESSRAKVRSDVPDPMPTGRKHLDSISFSAGASKVADRAQGRRSPPAVSNLAAEFPVEQRGIMQQIFEDTARTTLPAQIQADRSPAAAMAVRADSNSQTIDIDPMSLFEGSQNWAELAFAATKK